MSNAVKAVAGLAAIVFAPVLAPALLGGIGITSAAAIAVASAGIVLVGASLVGSSTNDSMASAVDQASVEGYAGAKLQTNKSNTAPVPVLYGTHKVGGNIIWQHTGAHKNANNTTNGYNRDYWSIMVLCDHEIEAINNLYAGETTMNALGSNKWETEYVHIKYNAFSSSARNVQDNIWIHDTSGSTCAGSDSDLSFASAVIPANCAFLAVHQVFDGEDTKNTALEAITANLTGKKIRTLAGGGEVTVASVGGSNKYFINGVQQQTLELVEGNTYVFNYPSGHPIRFSTTSNGTHASGSEYTTGVTHNSSTQSTIVVASGAPTLYYYCQYHSGMGGTANTPTSLPATLTYSNNPAEVLMDLLGTGLGIVDADLDLTSFSQAKADCVNAGFSCDIALIQQANIQSIIADVLATCRGKVFHSESKWKFKIDTKSQVVTDTLTNADVMSNTLSMSMSGSANIANKMILKYINPSDDYLSAEIVKEDTALQTYDGQIVQKILDIKGVTNATQATKLCEIALNSLRYSEDSAGNRIKQTPLAISFSTSVKNAHLEVGDVISLNHLLLDRVRQFLILSTQTDQSGVIAISAREYAETHFKNTSGAYLI
tara:strand:+ start:2505 stop:4307 length:1803 start_codon:yes stop_codon:yes gene_type:complete